MYVCMCVCMYAGNGMMVVSGSYDKTLKVCVCVYVCMYAYLYVCMYVCM
jgi:hypothetical protein